MSDWIVQQIRTIIPTAIGAVLAWLLTLGIELDAEARTGLTVGLTGVVVAAYYALASWVSRKWPVMGFLVGSSRQPTYGPSRKELKAGEGAGV